MLMNAEAPSISVWKHQKDRVSKRWVHTIINLDVSYSSKCLNEGGVSPAMKLDLPCPSKVWVHMIINCETPFTSKCVSEGKYSCNEGSRPLTATIHSGGHLSDALLVNMKPSDVRAVFASKVGGLMGLWADLSLQATHANVAFSSVAALLGSAGQANYAAANAVEDAYGAAFQVWHASSTCEFAQAVACLLVKHVHASSCWIMRCRLLEGSLWRRPKGKHCWQNDQHATQVKVLTSRANMLADCLERFGTLALLICFNPRGSHSPAEMVYDTHSQATIPSTEVSRSMTGCRQGLIGNR